MIANPVNWLLLNLKFRGNKISADSRISHNSVVGTKNIFKKSLFFNSVVGDNSIFSEGFCFSSKLGSHIQCLGNSSLHATKASDYFYINNYSLIVNATIGKYTYFAGRNKVFYTRIGSYCSIAENVMIGHAEHPVHNFSTSPIFYKTANEFKSTFFVADEYKEYQDTIIGNDVWIGANAFIKSGVKIGDGAVIGAGAVVTKDIDDYVVAAGVPAKFIRYRFNKNTIEELLRLKWWDMNDDELKKNISFLKELAGNLNGLDQTKNHGMFSQTKSDH